MSESELKLANAPIVEAVIDIDCDMPLGFDLAALVIECSEPDWDGAGANALDVSAVLNAQNFIRALPADIPMPDLAPDPDGSISLDWIQSQHRLFSVSVGPGARIAYAWLDGGERGHAVAPFDGDTIPARVIEGIRGIMHHGKTTVQPCQHCR